MTRMRSLAGWLVLLGGLGLTGCATLQQKGDLGAIFLQEDGEPEVADAQHSSALKGWLAAEDAKATAVDVVEVKPVEVAVAPAPVAPVAPVVEESKGADVVNVEPVAAPEKETEGAPAIPVADPPTPPAPTPPAPKPVEETPEQRADRLLRESRSLTSVQDQSRLAEAEAEFQSGLKLFKALHYTQAKKHFERAAQLDPTHAAAQKYLGQTRAMLGVRKDGFHARLAQLEEQERVRIQEQVAVLMAAIEEGHRYEDRGEQIDLSVSDSGKQQILADQLANLRQAEIRYRRVREILNYLPPTFDLPNERRMVDESLSRVSNKIAAKEDEISFLRRQEAARIAEEQGLRETLLFKQRIQKLLEQVRALYNRGEYRSSERLAIRVLQLDPLNGDAEGLKRKARAAQHGVEKVKTAEDYKEALTTTWEEGDAGHIPYGDLLVYPDNWDEISKRPERMAIGRTVREEQWKLDIRKKLQRKVSFEFVDTPLQEAISFLRSLTNVTMIIDPKVMEAGPPAINLRVTDMSLDLALGWILRLADLDYAFKDKAIFISRKTMLVEDVELRIYDVSDLTLTIPDMPGPDLQVQTVDPTDASVGGGVNNPFITNVDAEQITPANIADMIRAHVRPESWDPAQGTSIEERSGRLVVMQRPEVHQLIDQLLNNFRATQKIMVNIESRFLLLREANMENIGVEVRGLDGLYNQGYTNDGLHGLFGDIANVLGGTAPPGPGWTSMAPQQNKATFTTVGAVRTSSIQYAGNSPDTFSGTTSVANAQQSGLAMQIAVLSDPQYQLFIRAGMARESVSTLLTPRLTVYNTQRAHMFVANQANYIADYEISGDSFDPLIRQYLVGVVLDVRPTVSSDRRYVTLEIRPAQVELANFRTTFMRQLIGWTVGNSVAVFPVTLPIEFPELIIRRVRTTVIMPDGGILFLGGLYRNTKFAAENGVPFLSDLPVVGRLFRWNVIENAKSNLAILVSPKIILFDEEEAKL